MAGVNATGFRQVRTSLMRARAGDPTSDLDLGRFADYRVSGAGKGHLAPVSPTQVAVVRQAAKEVGLSFYHEQVGFWQSQHADSRACTVGAGTVKVFAKKNGIPLILLLGDPIFDINGRTAVLVQDSQLIRTLISPEAAFSTTASGHLTSFPMMLVGQLTLNFSGQLPNKTWVSRIFAKKQDELTCALRTAGLTHFLKIELNEQGTAYDYSFVNNTGQSEPAVKRGIVNQGYGLLLISE